jgi:AraC-like DNA-binding protein
MLYLTHTPAPPLGEFVANLWFFSDLPAHTRECILPTGTLELVVNLQEDEFRIYGPAEGERCRRVAGAMVSGAYRRPFVIDTFEQASVMGVHFRPGGAFPFLGVPPGALADTHLDLRTLWGREGLELRERLCAARTTAERFGILEAALRAHLYRSLAPRGEVRLALNQLGRARGGVAELAARVGLSHRRFIEIFSAQVGMPPKLFGRVRRFQRALALAAGRPAPGWGRVAIAAGYFDQSHLIREFEDLSGFSPAQLVLRAGERVKEHHLALGDVVSSAA